MESNARHERPSGIGVGTGACFIFAAVVYYGMSESETESERPLRTVTPEYFGRPDREMDVIGWMLFLTLVVVIVPLLPFIVIVWVISKLIDVVNPRT